MVYYVFQLHKTIKFLSPLTGPSFGRFKAQKPSRLLFKGVKFYWRWRRYSINGNGTYSGSSVDTNFVNKQEQRGLMREACGAVGKLSSEGPGLPSDPFACLS